MFPWYAPRPVDFSAFGVSTQVLATMIRVCTHPRVLRHPSSLTDALEFCRVLLQQPNATIISRGMQRWSAISASAPCMQNGSTFGRSDFLSRAHRRFTVRFSWNGRSRYRIEGTLEHTDGVVVGFLAPAHSSQRSSSAALGSIGTTDRVVGPVQVGQKTSCRCEEGARGSSLCLGSIWCAMAINCQLSAQERTSLTSHPQTALLLPA
jgi:hypothetical protein